MHEIQDMTHDRNSVTYSHDWSFVFSCKCLGIPKQLPRVNPVIQCPQFLQHTVYTITSYGYIPRWTWLSQFHLFTSSFSSTICCTTEPVSTRLWVRSRPTCHRPINQPCQAADPTQPTCHRPTNRPCQAAEPTQPTSHRPINRPCQPADPTQDSLTSFLHPVLPDANHTSTKHQKWHSRHTNNVLNRTFHTQHPFNGLVSRTIWVSQHQKDQTNHLHLAAER